MDSNAFQVRVTGVLMRGEQILLVKQRVSDARGWSLPGGRAEAGETLGDAVVRELKEETGLDVRVKNLLYVCDMPDATPPVLHVTFLLDHVGGDIALPTNEHDDNPISDVRFVPVADLTAYGFTPRFAGIVGGGFSGAGGYMGIKGNIGL